MKYLLSLLILALGFSSCEREVDANRISVSDLYGEFEINDSLDVTKTSIDFEMGEKPVFTAEFNKPVLWNLTITGKKSGAVKNISGLSKELNSENAAWDGSTSTLPFFRKGEDCTAELNISSEDTTLVLAETLTVKTAKTNSGSLVSDFEGGINDDWDWFFQDGVGFANLRHRTKAAQGEYYYKMFGECSWDWLIGMVNIPATDYLGETLALSDDPNEVYFNVMLNFLKGQPRVLIRFNEDDNNDGVFDIETEDSYSITVQSTRSGWQQISLKYSDLVVVDENGKAITPNGNNVHNPNLLDGVDILLLADPLIAGVSQVNMDYMIFTENEPLKP